MSNFSINHGYRSSINSIFPGLENHVYEVEFILDSTTLYYNGINEYRINGYREKGIDALNLKYDIDLDLVKEQRVLTDFLRKNIRKRIIHIADLDSFIIPMCRLIDEIGNYICLGLKQGASSLHSLSVSYYAYLALKPAFHNYFTTKLNKAYENITLIQIAKTIVKNAIDYEERDLVYLKTAEELLVNFKLSSFTNIDNFSTIKYEGAKNVSTLQFVNNWDEDIAIDLFFESPIVLRIENDRLIRKVMEMSDQTYSLIVVNEEIVALSKTNFHSGFKIVYKDVYVWSLVEKEIEVFSYNNGTITYPLLKLETKSSNINEQIQKQFVSISGNKLQAIEAVIEMAKKQSHGTSVIIFDAAVNETERLCSGQRGIKIRKTDLGKVPDIVDRISSIDGSIFIDKDCVCHGIGIILDGKALLKGDMSRGARYNSVRNYIALKAREKINCLGIIVSEDGMTEIVSTIQFET